MRSIGAIITIKIIQIVTLSTIGTYTTVEIIQSWTRLLQIYVYGSWLVVCVSIREVHPMKTSLFGTFLNINLNTENVELHIN